MKEDTSNKNPFELKWEEKYVISANSSKQVKEVMVPLLLAIALFVFCALFDVGEFRELVPADHPVDNFMDNVMDPFVKAVSYIMIPLCIFGIIFYIKDIRSKKDLLSMDEMGFEENLSRRPLGFVQWSDVEKLVVKPFFTAKFFEITLKTPTRYYKNDTRKKVQEKIVFTSQLFIDRGDEVEQIMRYYIDKSKKQFDL